jgi:DNA replication and repair protein RecF
VLPPAGIAQGANPPGATLLITRIQLRGFRNLTTQEVGLGEGITLLWGPNGAGKTNLLEALCTALTGRSCRTRSEREVIGFGERLARAEAVVANGRKQREFLWSLGRDGRRRHLVDGKSVTREHLADRPALAIFLPDRLALVKGPPGLRRAHLDRLSSALWPARAEARRRYGRALAQRNALLGRIKGGGGSLDLLEAWDRELALAGAELIASRREGVAALEPEFAAAAADLGLPGAATLLYRPRSDTAGADELRSELAERRAADVQRGHTGHGPHLDELALLLDERSLRLYGSQGEQRMALLALLFAERRALLEACRTPPLMLLDDVMSELDAARRVLLARRLAEGGGQAVITATEPDHLPTGFDRAEVAVRDGEAIPAAPLDQRLPPEPASTAVGA